MNYLDAQIEFRKQPTLQSAGEFLARSLEANEQAMLDNDDFADYVAEVADWLIKASKARPEMWMDADVWVAQEPGRRELLAQLDITSDPLNYQDAERIATIWGFKHEHQSDGTTRLLVVFPELFPVSGKELPGILPNQPRTWINKLPKE